MLNYIEHDKLPQNFHKLGISMVNICKNNSGIEEENVIEVDFGPTPNVLREINYINIYDIYEGIHSEIVNTTGFDENSDLSTTYLGTSDRSKMTNLQKKSLFPYQNMGVHQESCSMEQNVSYFWIQVQANHSCQNHSTCIVSHLALCQNLLPRQKEFR